MKDWSRRSFVSMAAGAPALGWLAPSLARVRQRLAPGGIRAPEPIVEASEPALLLGVNESWNRTTGASLAEAFYRAAA